MKKASSSQIGYAKHLAKQQGLKSPTAAEIEAMDDKTISKLIDGLKKKRGEPVFYGNGKFKGWIKKGELWPKSKKMSEEVPRRWSADLVSRLEKIKDPNSATARRLLDKLRREIESQDTPDPAHIDALHRFVARQVKGDVARKGNWRLAANRGLAGRILGETAQPTPPDPRPSHVKLIDQTEDRFFWRVKRGSKNVWLITTVDGRIDEKAPVVNHYRGNYMKLKDAKQAWGQVKGALGEAVAMFRAALTEYGGVGGRIAGARHPYLVPRASARSQPSPMTPEQLEKAKRRELRRREVRARMRELVRESWFKSRRRLRSISG